MLLGHWPSCAWPARQLPSAHRLVRWAGPAKPSVPPPLVPAPLTGGARWSSPTSVPLYSQKAAEAEHGTGRAQSKAAAPDLTTVRTVATRPVVEEPPRPPFLAAPAPLHAHRADGRGEAHSGDVEPHPFDRLAKFERTLPLHSKTLQPLRSPAWQP